MISCQQRICGSPFDQCIERRIQDPNLEVRLHVFLEITMTLVLVYHYILVMLQVMVSGNNCKSGNWSFRFWWRHVNSYYRLFSSLDVVDLEKLHWRWRGQFWFWLRFFRSLQNKNRCSNWRVEWYVVIVTLLILEICWLLLFTTSTLSAFQPNLILSDNGVILNGIALKRFSGIGNGNKSNVYYSVDNKCRYQFVLLLRLPGPIMKLDTSSIAPSVLYPWNSVGNSLQQLQNTLSGSLSKVILARSVTIQRMSEYWKDPRFT